MVLDAVNAAGRDQRGEAPQQLWAVGDPAGATAGWFEGNFQDYEADRHRRLGTDADQPHRIKYKPLRT